MKKIAVISIFITCANLLFSVVANAQAIQPPRSITMQGNAGIGNYSASTTTITPVNIPVNNSYGNKPVDSEVAGYSLAFLAYHYNDFCKLGIDKNLIDTLASELKKAEQNKQISTEVINQNVAETQKLYKENPTQFCKEAQQIAATIKTMFTSFGGFGN